MTHTLNQHRGYTFEHKLVEELNQTQGWQALRLGSATKTMPDVLATYHKGALMEGPDGVLEIWPQGHTEDTIMIAMECKTSTKNNILVPEEQIRRCYEIFTVFMAYAHNYIVLAFKFKGKVRGRKEKKYFVLLNAKSKKKFSYSMSINYAGKVAQVKDKMREINEIKPYENFYRMLESLYGVN